MAKRYHIIRALALLMPFALGACDSMLDWADRNGPVIGQRCEHWQCFTDSGQQESEMIRKQRQKEEAAAANGSKVPAGNPGAQIPGGAPAAAQQQLAPPAGPEGAYKYVPRAQAAPAGAPAPDASVPAAGASPYDGQYQPGAQ